MEFRTNGIIKKIKKVVEPIILLLLLMLLIIISYANVNESISVVKYYLQLNIDGLIKNYNLFLYAQRDFFSNTLLLHQGDVNSGWNTAFYLLPLFIFIKLLGSLSLKNIYLFTITTSLTSLLLFYYWIRRFWNKEVAFFSTFFLGYSAVFQEVARSGSYIAFSVMFAMIWIIYLYKSLESEKIVHYFFLGVLTGIAMYGYGTLRPLFLVGCLQILFLKNGLRSKRFFLFFIGIVILVLPGIILKINKVNLSDYREHLHWLFFDEKNIRTLDELKKNWGFFLNRVLGGPQIVPPLITNNYHAHFLNRLLVVPFIMGITQALKFKKDSKYLLLTLSLIIYATPLITSAKGCAEARRSLLYIIPTYLFIGLGMNKILVFINSLLGVLFKRVSQLLIVVGFIFIIWGELFYINNYIVKSNRDLGMLKFANVVNTLGIKGNIYYLETINPSPGGAIRQRILPVSLYMFTAEGVIFEAALMDSRNSSLESATIKDLGEITRGLKSFYVAKSPYVSQRKFEASCKKYLLTYKLLADFPVTNFRGDKPLLKKPQDASFKLYFIVRQ